MTPASIASNPFAMMMDPDAVLAAVAGSERLARLHSRICRPLDTLPPEVSDADATREDTSTGLASSPRVSDTPTPALQLL